jgi:hypothetical protein
MLLILSYKSLGISELPKHPSYKNIENKKNLKILNKVNCTAYLTENS